MVGQRGPCELGNDGGTATSGRFSQVAGANSVLFRPHAPLPCSSQLESLTQPVTLYDLPGDGYRAFPPRGHGNRLERRPVPRCVFPEAVVECKMFRSPLETVKVGYVEAHMAISGAGDQVNRLAAPTRGDDGTIGGCMKKEVDVDDFDLESEGGGHAAGIAGAMALAAVVGVGVGLLIAPQPGERTRKALRKRLASLGEDLENGFDEFEERSRPARKEIRKRAERLRERGEKVWEGLEDRLDRLEHRDEDHSTGIISLLTLFAGLGATYLMTSEQAAPTRAKVRDAANQLKQRATDRWDRFQERRHANGGASQRGTQPEPQGGGAGES